MKRFDHLLLSSLCLLVGYFVPARAEDEGRSKVRILYDFEDPSDLSRLMKRSENVTLTTAEGGGVTHGARCAV